MPRSTRKSRPQKPYLQYDRSKIPEAINKIKAGILSINKASQEYNIPFSTLRDRTSDRLPVDAKPGASTVLTADEELQLKTYLIKLSELGVGKSKEQVQELAYMIIRRDPSRSSVSETWVKKLTAGKDWYYSFMKRNPELSLRKPEKLSKARSKMTNDAVLNNFYNVLEPILTDDDGTSMDPACVFNCDETGVPLDFRPSRVVAAKKARNVWSISSGDKTQITVMGCGNAAGTMIPPLVVFKGVRKNTFLVDGAPEGWQVKFSKSGWMNSVVFEEWFEHHFIPYVDQNVRAEDVTKKVVLFLDGHLSHETLYTIEVAVRHHINIVCLPPQTTHVLQPLDISFFKSLKARWDKVNETFCRKHHGNFVKKGNFMRIFQEAWDHCSSNIEMVKNGFSRIGLSPFKRMTLKDLIRDKDLCPANCLNKPHPTSGGESTTGLADTAGTSHGTIIPSPQSEESACNTGRLNRSPYFVPTSATSQLPAVSTEEIEQSEAPDLFTAPVEFPQDLERSLDEGTQRMMDEIASVIASESRIITFNNTVSSPSASLSTHNTESLTAQLTPPDLAASISNPLDNEETLTTQLTTPDPAPSTNTYPLDNEETLTTHLTPPDPATSTSTYPLDNEETLTTQWTPPDPAPSTSTYPLANEETLTTPDPSTSTSTYPLDNEETLTTHLTPPDPTTSTRTDTLDNEETMTTPDPSNSTSTEPLDNEETLTTPDPSTSTSTYPLDNEKTLTTQLTTPDPGASTSTNPLDDVLVIPEFDTSMPTKRKRRQVDPFCRVLTSEVIIEQKRQKLAAGKLTNASKTGKQGSKNNKQAATPSQTAAAGANKTLKNKKSQAAKKTTVVQARGKQKGRTTRSSQMSTRRTSCKSGKRTAKD